MDDPRGHALAAHSAGLSRVLPERDHRAVEVEGEDEALVAEHFLTEMGLLGTR